MTANKHESIDRNARYAQHVTELAAAFKVRLIVWASLKPHQALASWNGLTGNPVALIAPVIDETTYAVALHEMGHNLHPTGRLYSEMSPEMRATGKIATLRDVRLKLLAEESAWEWAHHVALEWTDVMCLVERLSLDSYRAMARKLGVKP